VGLKPPRRTCRRNQFLAQRGRCTFDCPQADDKTFLGRLLLANHIGVAAMRRNRSAIQSDNPSSFFERDADAQARQSPSASQRRTVLRAHPSSAAMRLEPRPAPSAAASPTPRPAPSSHPSADRPSAKEPSHLLSFQPLSDAERGSIPHVVRKSVCRGARQSATAFGSLKTTSTRLRLCGQLLRFLP
jgi:hypothetical protein